MTDRNQNDEPEDDIGPPRLVLPVFNGADLAEEFRTGRRPQQTEEQLEAMREMQAEINEQREAEGLEIYDNPALEGNREEIHLHADPEALEQVREQYNAAAEAMGNRNQDDDEEPPPLTELQHAHAVIEKLKQALKSVMEPPLTTAVIVDVLASGNVMVAHGGSFKEVAVVPEIRSMMMPCVQVLLDEDSMTVTKIALRPYRTGAEGSVERILDNGFAEIDVAGKIVKAMNPANAQQGDLAVLDSEGMAIIDVVPKDESKFQLKTVTSMTWEDIGGLEEAKQDMIETVQHPYMYPELYEKYGRKLSKGTLLWGPPGCGKTLIARVCASVLADMHGRATVNTGYIYVKGPEILSQWVGRAEQTIRELFASAREHKEKNGYPAVLFIDEADAIMGKRGSGVSSDMEKTIVPMFLAEMDGLDDSGAFVILATNKPDSLDSAVIRDGRIDRKIEIGRPGLQASTEILKIHLSKMPHDGLNVEEMANVTAKYIFSKKAALTKLNMKDGSSRYFGLCNLLNGAMLEGVIQNAISHALARDIASGSFSGFTQDDLYAGVRKTIKGAKGISFKSELKAFVAPFKADLEGMEAV